MSNKFDAPLVVGIVGHADIDLLPEIKYYFENLDGFRLIYFKTSSEKLYIWERGDR
jgi:hypothetical protein